MIEAPSLFIAFLAGIVSFLSPCVLPLVPAYIGYMSGSALNAARVTAAAGRRTRIPVHSNANANPARCEARGDAIGMTAPSPLSSAARTVAVAPMTATATATATAASGTVARTTNASASASARWIVMAHALLFVLGLTLVFVVVIGGLAGAFSYLLREQKTLLQRVMGVILVIFGLQAIGLINIPFMNYTRRLDVRPAASLGYLRSFLIGMGFGIGWTPCVGPTLGAIFTLAANQSGAQAFLPALAYSLGLGIPFLLTAFAMGQVSAGLKRITRHSYSLRVGRFTLIDQVNIISLISGLLLIMMGLLIFTNALTILTTFAPNFGI